MSFWAKNTPYRDLEPSRFEVDLNKVLKGEGPEEYWEPKKFFSVTFATRELKTMIREVNRALETGNGLVWALKSPFGGGKTHALLVLYHAFRSPEDVPEEKSDDDPYGFPKPTVKATVVALDGRDVPAGGRGRPKTLWGKIADELGHYELLKEYDESLKPPEMEKLRQLLKEAGPTLILLDELPPYLEKGLAVEVGQTNLGRLTVTFLHSLLDAVKGAKTVLIITIPEEAYRERSAELDQLVRDANAIVTRIAEFRAPLSLEDLAGILRRRLFTKVDNRAATETSQDFYKFYLSKKDAFTPEALDPNYVALIEKDYPFHPSFIRLLADRIAAVPGFQSTRGVLRLMAAIVSSLRCKDIAGTLMPGDVDLSDQVVISELLKGHPVYSGVVESDIANPAGSARAQHLRDKPLAVRCATAVFMNSFTLSGKDYASLAPVAKEVALQVARPGENPFEVQETLESLSNYLFYMVSDQEPPRYFFTVVQNVVRLIEDEASKVTDTEAEEKVRVEIERATGSRPFEVVHLWNRMPEDKPLATLAVLSPSDGAASGQVPSKALAIWQTHGTGFRTYRNAIVFAYTTPSDAEKLVRLEKRLIACERLLSRESLVASAGRGDVEMVKVVEEINRRRLKGEKEKTSSSLKLQVVKAYANVAYPTVDQNGRATMSATGAASEAMVKTSIQETITHLLGMSEGIGKLADRLDAQYVFDSAIKPRFERGDRPMIKRVVESFYEDPALPLPLSQHVILSSISDCVRQGLFAVKEGENVYFRKDFTAAEHIGAQLVPPAGVSVEAPAGTGVATPRPTVPTTPASVQPSPVAVALAEVKPDGVKQGDVVRSFVANGLAEMDALIREWPLLNSELKPSVVRATLEVMGDKVELHLRDIVLLEPGRPPIPPAKLKTVVSDISTLSQVRSVALHIDVDGVQGLGKGGVERVSRLGISRVKVKGER